MKILTHHYSQEGTQLDYLDYGRSIIHNIQCNSRIEPLRNHFVDDILIAFAIGI